MHIPPRQHYVYNLCVRSINTSYRSHEIKIWSRYRTPCRSITLGKLVQIIHADHSTWKLFFSHNSLHTCTHEQHSSIAESRPHTSSEHRPYIHHKRKQLPITRHFGTTNLELVWEHICGLVERAGKMRSLLELFSGEFLRSYLKKKLRRPLRGVRPPPALREPSGGPPSGPKMRYQWNFSLAWLSEDTA